MGLLTADILAKLAQFDYIVKSPVNALGTTMITGYAQFVASDQHQPKF